MAHYRRIIRSGAIIGTLVACCYCTLFAMRGTPTYRNIGIQTAGASQMPAPITVDQITHNTGNIVTTVDNFGYVGGYSFYGKPSGEWPRGSGRNYLAEIKYWMGTVKENGDTAIANTEDDFQAIPSLISGVDAYKILLSTDTTRYYNFDARDTVGAGLGNPARGWREYNLDSSKWVYTRSYNPIDNHFYNSGPLSLQESHFRFNDAATDTRPLGVELTHTMLQWNYCYNEDFLFVIVDIKNTSTTDYPNFAFGLYMDIDVGGPDGTGENGRLGDLVAFDSTENLAWIYDADAFDPGWGPTVKAGVMGTKYLETPDGIGMTSFRNGDWNVLQDITDAGRYELIASNEFDQSLPPTDQYYIQCTNGINLTAGKSVRVVYALIAGADEANFRANAALAQTLYNNHFVGPQPPATPNLSVRAADRKVYLKWNDTSEVSHDPLTGTTDFAGYKLYRSDNQGKSWGLVNYQTGNKCLKTDYTPLALYTVNAPGEPIQHTYIDTGLYNGVDYWYCLTAFDRGDTVTGIDPLQSGFGVAGTAPNVVSVTPVSDPAGFYSAAGTVRHAYSGSDIPSEGSVVPILFDKKAVRGSEYAVTFEDTPSRTYWHLINMTTGDTVLKNQDKENLDPGMFDVADGIRAVIRNVDREPSHLGQSAFVGADTTLTLRNFWGPSTVILFGDSLYGDAKYRSTYELRYSGDTTMAPNVSGDAYVLYAVPFSVWNITTNQRVSLAVLDRSESGNWRPYRTMMIVNSPYNPTANLFDAAYPYDFSWLFKLDTATYHPQIGETFTFTGARLNGPEDSFTFKVDGVDATEATAELGRARVVPNPYFAQYSSMVETGEGESVLEFQSIPDQCKIRIYTLAGGLVKTIDHIDGTGKARWNLLGDNGQLVASGVYLYQIESTYGNHLGRFSVIK